MVRLLPKNTTSGQESGHDASLFLLFLSTHHRLMPLRSTITTVMLRIV
jgi:hypothetical protein